MSKKLKLTFKTEGSGTMEVSISNPQSGLSLATVKEKAAIMVPVFQTKAGNAATELSSAKYIETTETDIV